MKRLTRSLQDEGFYEIIWAEGKAVVGQHSISL